jgi:diguanylate cyclase (GGDEF)-like protein
MSFRTRLTSFFVLIVVLPIIAVGALVLRLLSDSADGKADARAAGVAAVAGNLYASQEALAAADARTVAGELSAVRLGQLRPRLAQLSAEAGLARIEVSLGRHKLADVGSRAAIAPGVAHLVLPGGPQLRVAVSAITAQDFVRQLASSSVGVVIRQHGVTLAASPAAARRVRLPGQGDVTVAGNSYRAAVQLAPGFGRHQVEVHILSSRASTDNALTGDRLLTIAGAVLFLLLAFGFSVRASRELHRQLSRFLEAARRLGRGDFSAPVPVEGEDEFAALGREFNRMSAQLEQRLRELSQERARLRESVARIGQTFAANLDREGLLRLALRTAMDATQADFGRISVRSDPEAPLEEVVREGDLSGLEPGVIAAEEAGLAGGNSGEADGEVGALTLTLGRMSPSGRVRGMITVARRDSRFSEDDRELLLSLASQATLALENVELHFQVRRQAVTDELTGLVNRGRFDTLLAAEMEQVRRYHHAVGLIMVDVDNFKSVNDTYGHQQGDLVLKHVARVLRETSREADTAARYGGEEMALILPHTDLEGSYAIAERVRSTVEGLAITRLDGEGVLRITASAGVAAMADGDAADLIAGADAALYQAKRTGKNRTVRAAAQATNLQV